MHYFDDPVLDSLVVLFSLLSILCVRSFLKVFPSLISCVNRWKINLEIEDSHQMVRSRNLVATVFYVPFCLMAYSYSLYNPEYFSGLSQVARVAVIIGVGALYILFRAFLNWQLEPRDYDSKTFIAANRSFFNFAILLFVLVFICGAALRAFVKDEAVVRGALLCLMGFSYLVYLFKKTQILASACNPFTTFLYLCSLELLPTGALALSAVLL